MQLRNVIVMFVLALLCVVGYLTLQGAAPTAVKVRAFAPYRVADVVSMTASATGQAVEARRDPKASDRWQLRAGSAWVRANPIRIEEIIGALQRSQVRQYFTEEELVGEKRSAFGLDDPIGELSVTTGSETVAYRIGQPTAEGGGHYADQGPGTGVFVVTSDAYSELLSGLAAGLRDMQALDIHTFDIGKIEILIGGKPSLTAERDLTHVWGVSVPYEGFADPRGFEEFLRALSATRLNAWVDDDAEVLSKYGLEEPRARVRLTTRGNASRTLLVGADADDGVFVMEEGTKSVALAGPDFKEATFLDPVLLRDVSFSRVGIDVKDIHVKLGDTNYRLRFEQSWDLVAPIRFPADTPSVRALTDDIKRWKTLEFLDRANPKDHGISEERAVLIEQTSGNVIRLFIGDEAPGGGVYAQREGTRGVERVDSAPIATMLRGYPQFRRKEVLNNWGFDALFFFGRGVGRGETAKELKLQQVVVERDLNATTPVWRDTRSGEDGNLDQVRLADVLRTLQGLRAATWVPFSLDKRQEWGVHSDFPETARFDFEFAPGSGMEAQQALIIGKRVPEGGYYAWVAGQTDWAFVIPDATAEVLLADLFR